MSTELFKRFLSSLIILPISVYLIIYGGYFFDIFLLICFLISLYEWHRMNKSNFYNVFGIFFLIFSFYLAYKLRNDFNNSFYYFLITILICVSTDIGGYVFGKFFKGPKLTKISPKKTYSGMFGGFLLSIIIIQIIFNVESLNFNNLIPINIFIFIILVSLSSQLGDICISYFKRKSKIKDTGRIIPGHGGILDRIDGVIFAVPISYLIIFNYNT